MVDKYHEFVNRYGIRHIKLSRDFNRINYGFATDSYTYREETIDMEIPRSGFDNLINIDSDFTRMWQDQRDEAYMRKKYPAIKEAYDKYLMLLELYR